MRLGDVITCGGCGARAVAQSSAPERWQEGWPLLLTWTHGPHPRHEAMSTAPEFCLWCAERRHVLGPNAPPLYRPRGVGEGPLNETSAGIPPPAPLGNKAPLERLEETRPAPAETEPAGRAPSPAGPLERYEKLAAAFHRETGMLAPGKDQPAAMNGSPSLEERAERWRSWCAARAAAAAPPKKARPPKGQLGLFG